MSVLEDGSAQSYRPKAGDEEDAMQKREPKKSETLEIRIPHETKTAFMSVCRARGVSASDVLRACVRRHLESAGGTSFHWTKEIRMAFLEKPRRRHILLGSAGALAACIAVVTLAVPAHAAIDPRIAAVFGWMDANHDGRVSRAEYVGASASAPPLGAVGIVVETTTPPPPHGETQEALFRRLDADGDGSLTLAEVAAAASVRTTISPAIAAADANADGSLTEGELAAYLTSQRAAAGERDPSAGVGLMVHGIIAARDTDHDGLVSLADLER
jgi:Ca2+-binding EF-hand superfamily protein